MIIEVHYDECDSEFLIDDNWGSNICPDCLDKKELVG